MKKKLGLLINPIAGIGGAVGLKGSDGATVQQEALARGAVKQAESKARLALEEILPLKDDVVVYAGAGDMGADLARSMGFVTEELALPQKAERAPGMTYANDTEALAQRMGALPVDILLFAGGDGTARNICAAVPASLPVLGIPAGVKIHSAVYATSPAAAGKALHAFLSAGVQTHEAEVMDIDEDAYRSGQLQARLFGYLRVPFLRGVMQNPKAASHLKTHDVSGICYDIAERIAAENDPETCYIFGAGSTVKRLMEHSGYEGTLLGIDVVQNGQVIAQDVAEAELLPLVSQYPCRLIVTVIGGQGHIFGRGNQQLSPRVIRAIVPSRIWVVAAAAKIFALNQQSLFVDTGEETLNEELRGYMKVIVGYQEILVCRVL